MGKMTRNETVLRFSGKQHHGLEKLQSFRRVTAPFAGAITARNFDTGDLIVAAGGKELFHLA